MTPRDLRNIHTTGNSCRDALPCANMALKLPQYFYLLMEKPFARYFQVILLTVRWHSATRKHLFPYPQGDRSGINIFFSFSMPCYAVFDKELNRNVVCYIRKGCNIYKQSFFCSKICIAISVSA